jgi:hypothetical protein
VRQELGGKEGVRFLLAGLPRDKEDRGRKASRDMEAVSSCPEGGTQGHVWV